MMLQYFALINGSALTFPSCRSKIDKDKSRKFYSLFKKCKIYGNTQNFITRRGGCSKAGTQQKSESPQGQGF